MGLLRVVGVVQSIPDPTDQTLKHLRNILSPEAEIAAFFRIDGAAVDGSLQLILKFPYGSQSDVEESEKLSLTSLRS